MRDMWAQCLDLPNLVDRPQARQLDEDILHLAQACNPQPPFSHVTRLIRFQRGKVINDNGQTRMCIGEVSYLGQLRRDHDAFKAKAMCL